MKNIANKQSNWKTKVKKVLNDVRQKYGIEGTFSIKDFHAVRESEGIEMLSEKYHDQLKDFPEITGALLVARNRRLIYLRCLDDVETAMHELGHYFLGHKGIGQVHLLKAEGSSKEYQELEADYFAELATKGEI